MSEKNGKRTKVITGIKIGYLSAMTKVILENSTEGRIILAM